MAAFAALRFPLDEIEVFHTDRGGGFAGERVERVLDVFGVTRSLSRPGNPYDSAVVESTNRLVRKELIHRNVYTNVVFCFNVCSTGSAVFFRSVG